MTMSLKVRERDLLLLIRTVAKHSQSPQARASAQRLVEIFKYYEFLKSLSAWAVITEAKRVGATAIGKETYKSQNIMAIIHHRFGPSTINLIVIIYGVDLHGRSTRFAKVNRVIRERVWHG